MKLRTSPHSLLFVFALVPLSSCEFITGVAPNVSQAGATQKSKTCLKLAGAPVLTAAVCDDIEAFKCASFIYSPDLKNANFSHQECFSYGAAQACLEVDVAVSDTSGMKASSDAKDFEVGGEFNNTTYKCAVPIGTQQKWLNAESDSLASTVELLQQKCRGE